MPAATRGILDRIRRAAAAGRALAPEDGAALAQAIATAQRDGITIDAALGLAPGWQRAARLRERDAALREMAASMGGSARERARQIHTLLRRYAGSTYRFDRSRGAMPEGDRGRLFEILDTGGGDVVGFEAIRNVISDNEIAG